MKYFLQFLVLLYLSGCTKQSEEVAPGKEYLNEVFQIVEQHSINRDSVDMNKIKEDAYLRLSSNQTVEDFYPIVESVLRKHNDNHSFFWSKQQVKDWRSTSKTKSKDEIITFSGRLLNHEVGYIHLKGFNSGDPVSTQNYADSLLNLIKSIDSPSLKGWVLNFRQNAGGNCWPMLAGLGPILGEGICGYFIDNQGKERSWFYEDRAAGIDSKSIARVSLQPYGLFKKQNPVVVLTGPETASSGETVETTFREKTNTRNLARVLLVYTPVI